MSASTEPPPLGAGLTRGPSLGERAWDRAFRGAAAAMALGVVAVLALLVAKIGTSAWPAIREFGAGFLVRASWDKQAETFGIGAALWGTLYSALIAVGLGTLFGVAIAIFLTESFLPRPVRNVLGRLVELLAAIPSVIYGLWGIYVVVPFLRGPSDWLHAHAGWFPLFGTPSHGVGLLPSAVVLSIMVLPTIAALAKDAIREVPARLRDAAYGLGATRWEVILLVTLPTAATGIAGAIVIALGRALGETMALAMLVGNKNVVSWSLFSPANTLAALLANNFPEATGLESGALMYAAVVLLGLTLLVNMIGSLIIARATAGLKGLR